MRVSIFVEDFDVLDFMKDGGLDLMILDYVLDNKVVGLVDGIGRVSLLFLWLLQFHYFGCEYNLKDLFINYCLYSSNN